MARSYILQQQHTSQPAGRALATRHPWKRYRSSLFYLFVSPWLLGFVLLTLIPLIYALVISFTNFDGMSGNWHFIGVRNYIELSHDPDTWYSLSRTLLYTVIVVPLGIVGGLALAVLVNRAVLGIGLLRTLLYLPSTVPIVGAAVIWKLIFDRDTGALNAIWEALGGHTITWLVDPMAFYAMIILVFWGVGGGMILSLAALQGLPQETQEAARVDGANSVQCFFRISLPQLSPILFFQLVTGIIAALQTFAPALLLSAGASTSAVGNVQRSNFLYMINVYQQIFGLQRLGYGSALLWVFFVIVLVFTLLVFRSSNFWVYYEVDRDQ